MRKNNNNKKRLNKRRMNPRNGLGVVSAFKSALPGLLPIPIKTRVTLRYQDIFLLSCSTGVGSYIYSGNSVFDPDVSGSGHQPYYFDRYAAIYSRYVVLNSRIKISTSIDTSSGQCVNIGLIGYHNNGVTVDMAGIEEIGESPFGVFKLMVNTPVTPTILTKSLSNADLFGTTEHELMTNPDLWTLTSASPVESTKWKIVCINSDSTVTAFTLAFTAMIEYDVLFTQLANEAPSAHKANIPRREAILDKPLSKQSLKDLGTENGDDDCFTVCSGKSRLPTREARRG